MTPKKHVPQDSNFHIRYSTKMPENMQLAFAFVSNSTIGKSKTTREVDCRVFFESDNAYIFYARYIYGITKIEKFAVILVSRKNGSFQVFEKSEKFEETLCIPKDYL